MKKLTSILVLFLFVFSLTSCEKESVEDTAVSMIQNVIGGDYEALSLRADGFVYEKTDLPELVENALRHNVSYEISSVTETDSKTKEVTFKITNFDTEKIISVAMAEISRLTFDEKNIDSSVHSAEVMEIYQKVLSENQAVTVTDEVTLTFKKNGANWVCMFDEASSKDLVSAILGGYKK